MMMTIRPNSRPSTLMHLTCHLSQAAHHTRKSILPGYLYIEAAPDRQRLGACHEKGEHLRQLGVLREERGHERPAPRLAVRDLISIGYAGAAQTL